MASTRYTRTAISLHWLIAALIVTAFVLGEYMADLRISPDKLRYYAWHKWLGITVLGFAMLRLLWRLTHKPPPLPIGTPRWQLLAAAAGHWVLYALLFLIPLSGWAYSSASGYSVVYLGQFPLPDWVPKDKLLAATLKERHEQLTTLLMVVAGIHMLAAFKHHFVDRDGLLHRMWFTPGSSKDKKL